MELELPCLKRATKDILKDIYNTINFSSGVGLLRGLLEETRKQRGQNKITMVPGQPQKCTVVTLLSTRPRSHQPHSRVKVDREERGVCEGGHCDMQTSCSDWPLREAMPHEGAPQWAPASRGAHTRGAGAERAKTFVHLQRIKGQTGSDALT